MWKNEIDLNNTYFIGDSFNDKEIMQIAGTSACTFHTEEILKEKCNFIIGTCEDVEVYEFITYIENKILRDSC